MKFFFKTLIILLMGTTIGISQQVAKVSSGIELEKRAAAYVDLTSKKVEISNYQQKACIKVLSQAFKELENIRNSRKSESGKTEAYEKLAQKQEYSLRGILNDTQYEMLAAILKQQ